MVGAGPSGISVAAFLHNLGINNVVLEKEDYCALFVEGKNLYLRTFAHCHIFHIKLNHLSICRKNNLFNTQMSMLSISTSSKNSKLVLNQHFTTVGERNGTSNQEILTSRDIKLYASNFLIFATGENNEGYNTKIAGIENFRGEMLHSSDYRSGENVKIKKWLSLDTLILG